MGIVDWEFLGEGWVSGKAVSSGGVASHQKSAFVRKM
jgi:hypothetical protein